ncbi:MULTISPECIES: hypothetical protein [Rhodopseudomonas]|uniref:Uncharacterized protein n=1 Tax=Rhodopseudomonas palustris TaxID=1076 RepID=A0A0D7F3Y2_RHOPL|nr:MULTISPECIES: hypothetical protein [Rhodopseudomonas]KIZ47510.1 hypothetical protein OO17_03820 [Rhodopseudomonas palustris]MDF3811700.1 hypothetical protein [Rhodopseudomonas sp. BAL398]WOK17912.1 hypothetical protein RBJ75_28025 [Rhodopseudomonas sp. BAL398]
MLRFFPKDPALCAVFKSHTYRYHLLPLAARDVPRFLKEIEGRLEITGLSLTGAGEPAGYIGNSDNPTASPIYWNH